MIIDLDAPLYTQADVLKLLPELKAKQLQNWSERGILDAGDQKPGKGSRRRYTVAGVLGLDFMRRATEFGVPPSEAAEMAHQYVDAADSFLRREPDVIVTSDGCRWLPIRPDNFDRFRRGMIFKDAAGQYLFRLDGEGIAVSDPRFQTPETRKFWEEFKGFDIDSFAERTLYTFGIFLEVDYLIAMTLNRMFLLEGGKL
jgi:DNA-binding transcriptional MerR regulator